MTTDELLEAFPVTEITPQGDEVHLQNMYRRWFPLIVSYHVQSNLPSWYFLPRFSTPVSSPRPTWPPHQRHSVRKWFNRWLLSCCCFGFDYCWLGLNKVAEQFLEGSDSSEAPVTRSDTFHVLSGFCTLTKFHIEAIQLESMWHIPLFYHTIKHIQKVNRAMLHSYIAYVGLSEAILFNSTTKSQ